MRLLLSVLLTVAFVTSASAQPKLPTINLAPVLQQVYNDAIASLQDANDHQDKIAAACYSAIADAAQARLSAQNVAGGGLLLAFQKLRDLNRLSASPQGTSLILGCAALVQDAKLNMLDFFTKIGGAVLLKGLLVP